MAKLLIGWLAIVLLALPAAAQAPLGALPDRGTAAPGEIAPDSPEEARALLSGLSDEQARALLLRRLDAEAAERAGAAPLMDLEQAIGTGLDGFGTAILWAAETAPNLPGGFAEALAAFYAPRGIGGTAHLLAVLALALAAATAARRLLARRAGALLVEPQAAPAALGAQLRVLGGRLGVELAGALVFLGTAWGVISALHPPEPLSYLILFFLIKQPILHVQVMGALSRFLLAPQQPDWRLVYLDDATAVTLHRGLVVFAAIAGMRLYLSSFLGGHGVDLSQIRLGFWLNLALYGWLFWLVWRTRRGLVRLLTGHDGAASPANDAIARAFPWFAMGLIAGFWVLTETFVGLRAWGLLDGRLPLTCLLIVFAPAADRLIRVLVDRFGGRMQGEGEVAARAHGEKQRGLVRIGRVLTAALLLWVIAGIWSFDLHSLASAGVGARFAGRLLEAVLVLGVGYVLWEGARIWFNLRLSRETGAEEQEDEGGGEGGGAGGSRLATVLPLVSAAAQVSIWVITGLVALSSLGIDTTPLLAGAGIVGLAVGFGAQKLVADIVAGIFFLIDDAFRVGEYVEVEGTVGTVERISVRSLRLRHHEGPVHTIPFGEIPKVTNYSRDWVIMKLRFTVPFDTDLMLVKKIFKQIGKDMMADERFADDFLQPFKSQGVLEVDDVGMVIRGKFMAKPGRQWVLRKEIYARVQQAFEGNAIQFARREVRVKIDDAARPLSEEERRTAAAAAVDIAAGDGDAGAGLEPAGPAADR